MMSSAKKDLFDKVIRVYPNLSPKKKRVADYIIKDYKKLFLMTAREVAEECRVSEPTIIRFTNDLGFSGYQEFVQYMKGLLHIELTAVERLVKASRRSDHMNTLDQYCQNAIGNLENLQSSISEKDLKSVARVIFNAEQVYVVGYRASTTLAFYFGYLLSKILENVFLDTSLSWRLMDKIARNGKSGVMFVIAFPRYPMKVIHLLEYARRYRVKIIGLSDTPKSPVIALSDQYILIDLESVSFIDPFAHIITYLGALIHEITFLDQKRAMKYLSRFDNAAKSGKEFFTEESADLEKKQKFDPAYLTLFQPGDQTDQPG
ncbi:MAG: MurR/RpiR family transcriptional regulator [Desulfobacterales bacterium]